MLTFESGSFEDTTKALLVFNEFIKGEYSYDELLDIIRTTAHKIYNSDPKATYCGAWTWGFVLTFYDEPNGRRRVAASVSSLLLNNYIKNNKLT